ncbi:MAG: FRG domain-containing protein [Candidatus Gracilibacteria bacterium]
MDKFEHIHFNNPQDLISFLTPENKIWGGEQNHWIFRGQAQSDWGLHPKLTREIINDEHTDKTRNSFYWYENHILNNFINQCREAGLELPIIQKNHQDISMLNFDEQLHISALGQHYGLPTRLLDWTENRYNAIFFALDIINHFKKYSKTSDLSIWCLDTQYTELDGLPLLIEGNKYSLKKFNPLFHGNKNALSQLGVFTYMESKFDRTRENNHVDVIKATLDKNTADINHYDLNFVLNNGKINFNNRRKNYTIGYKLTISRKYFNFLESWLRNRFITYHNLFPSYQGAVINSTYIWNCLLRQDGAQSLKTKKHS